MREKEGERGGREKWEDERKRERSRNILSEEVGRREEGEERYVDPPLMYLVMNTSMKETKAEKIE